MAADVATRSGAERGARFARGKFLQRRPVMLLARPALQDRLTAGAGQRLTVVLGSAGAGKSVLLSSWAAARPPGATSWLSCDEADANPARFWTGFIEAARVVEPGFGADAADLLALDGVVSQDHLRVPPGELTERRALVRQILLAAAAIERGDPMMASAVAGVLHAARVNGFLNTVVTTAPQVTSYLVEHAPQLRPDPFTGQLIAAALQARAIQLDGGSPGRGLAEPLTAAELRILKLLPTSTYLQIAETLYISRNTVKVHLRSVYQKLGVASRAQAIERAVDLSLL